MPSQILYLLMNYGSMTLVMAAMVVGIVLTKGTVRTLVATALAVDVVRFGMSLTVPGFVYSLGEMAILAYTLLQMVLSVGSAILLIAAAVVGARQLAHKDAVISALTDPQRETWTQPESSPDPRLLPD